MNLLEFTLNLSIASFLMLIAISFLSSLSFHSDQLTQKITLEDTALQALLTLDTNIQSSSLSYCATQDHIINHTHALDSQSRYQWQNQQLTTYQKTKAIYLEQAMTPQQTSLLLPFKPTNPWLILDDCQHSVLSEIANIQKIGDTYAISLNHSLDTFLTPPIMIGTLHMTRFSLGPPGLYRKTNTNHRDLIFANIKTFNLCNHTLTLEAQNHNYDIKLQKPL